MSDDDEDDPLTAFLKHAADQLSDRHRQELEHLQTWRQSNYDPEHLRPLLQAYEPLIQKRMSQWRAPAVPEPAFRAEMQKHFVKALKTYDPTKGAALPTHVENTIRKAQRFNVRYQNVGYIPEAKANKIGKIDRAKAKLEETFGRPATHAELGEHLGIPVRTITQIETARAKDIPASRFESDPTEHQISQDREILALLPYRLDPREQQVFNHLYGLQGAPQIQSGNDLARTLNMSPSEVSRIRSSILKKYKEAKQR